MSASDKEMMIPKAQEMIRNRDPELTYGESMDVMKNKIYNPTFAGNGCYKIRASKNAQVRLWVAIACMYRLRLIFGAQALRC
jgi:hypothetical protein